MKHEQRIVQPPRCVLFTRFFNTGTIISLVGYGKYIRVHMGEQGRMCVNDGGIVKKAFAATPIALTRMDVLIRR